MISGFKFLWYLLGVATSHESQGISFFRGLLRNQLKKIKCDI